MVQIEKVYDMDLYRRRQKSKSNQAKIDFWRVITASAVLSLSLFFSSGFLVLVPIEGIYYIVKVFFFIMAVVNLFLLKKFWFTWKSVRQRNMIYKEIDFIKYTLVFYYPFTSVVVLSCLASHYIAIQMLGYVLIMVSVLVSPLCYKVVRHSRLREKTRAKIGDQKKRFIQ